MSPTSITAAALVSQPWATATRHGPGAAALLTLSLSQTGTGADRPAPRAARAAAHAYGNRTTDAGPGAWRTGALLLSAHTAATWTARQCHTTGRPLLGRHVAAVGRALYGPGPVPLHPAQAAPGVAMAARALGHAVRTMDNTLPPGVGAQLSILARWADVSQTVCLHSELAAATYEAAQLHAPYAASLGYALAHVLGIPAPASRPARTRGPVADGTYSGSFEHFRRMQ
ncbi:hypothetical protein [Streptomyces sp. CS014]|uniref:hypothetical protein n=1 Tax=Streptomyces sp. CS014 TaxID=2162707 RepID=UPI000D652039|nr:hypothetical protein [Streptomyces sp. CS014]